MVNLEGSKGSQALELRNPLDFRSLDETGCHSSGTMTDRWGGVYTALVALCLLAGIVRFMQEDELSPFKQRRRPTNRTQRIPMPAAGLRWARDSNVSRASRCNFGQLPGMFSKSLWAPLDPPKHCNYRQFFREPAQPSKEVADINKVLARRSILALGNSIDYFPFVTVCKRLGAQLQPWMPLPPDYRYQYCKIGDFTYSYAPNWGVFEEPYVGFASYVGNKPQAGHPPPLHAGSLEHIKHDVVKVKEVMNNQDPDLIIVRSDMWDLMKRAMDGRGIYDQDVDFSGLVYSWFQGVITQVQTVKEAFPAAYVVWGLGTPIPTQPENQRDRFILSDMNQKIRSYAASHDFPYIDFQMMLAGQHPDSITIESINVHPTEKTHPAWTNMLLNTLAEHFSD